MYSRIMVLQFSICILISTNSDFGASLTFSSAFAASIFSRNSMFSKAFSLLCYFWASKFFICYSIFEVSFLIFKSIFWNSLSNSSNFSSLALQRVVTNSSNPRITASFAFCVYLVTFSQNSLSSDCVFCKSNNIFYVSYMTDVTFRFSSTFASSKLCCVCPLCFPVMHLRQIATWSFTQNETVFSVGWSLQRFEAILFSYKALNNKCWNVKIFDYLELNKTSKETFAKVNSKWARKWAKLRHSIGDNLLKKLKIQIRDV